MTIGGVVFGMAVAVVFTAVQVSPALKSTSWWPWRGNRKGGG